MTRDLRRAIDLYERFHQFEPTDIGEFHPDFHIPKYGYDAGEAERIYYRSDKLNPETGEDEGEVDYVHFFEPGVRLYRFDTASPSRTKSKVPARLTTSALARIGVCLGFTFQTECGLGIARSVGTPPELYAVPAGSLFVIEGMERVVSGIFGDSLRVHSAGIVG